MREGETTSHMAVDGMATRKKAAACGFRDNDLFFMKIKVAFPEFYSEPIFQFIHPASFLAAKITERF